MCRWTVLLVLASGCFARLGDGMNQESTGIDAGRGGTAVDAAGSLLPDAAVAMPDAPACYNGRVVYLNFDGVTLTKAAVSDATQNRASWMGVNSATVPPYRASAANRAQLIASITTRVRDVLSVFPVTVVTQRPTSGTYVMIVFGGTSNTVGTIYGGATSEHDCGDLVRSDVGWVSDATSDSRVLHYTIGAIGWGLGLNGTLDPNDCMCAWANNCTPNGAVNCTLATSIASTTSASPATTCPNMNPQNEQAVFRKAFCD